MTIHISADAAMALALAFNDPRLGLAQRREAAAQVVEDLIAFLDDTEGDPDLEPSLGWNGLMPFDGAAAVDLEADDSDIEDDGITEPSLGAPEIPPFVLVRGGEYGWHREPGSQTHWSQGEAEDGEQDDGDAPELVNEDGGDVQDEPHDVLDEGNDEMSLGWGLQMDQRKAAAQAPFWGDEDCWQVA